MNAYLSRLNPVERRFVIGVGLLFFAVINIFWVRPHFADWGNLKNRLSAAQQKQADYQRLIGQIPELNISVAKLMNEGDVLSEDQSTRFLSTIQSQGIASGISFNFPSKGNTTTNQFFIEQAQTISVNAKENQIVDFLYNIGSGNSLIRARAISLRPADASRFSLNANITLVASYQKKSKAPPARTTTSAPAVKPPGPTTSRSTGPAPRLTTNSVPKPTGPTSGSAAKPSDPKAIPSPTKK